MLCRWQTVLTLLVARCAAQDFLRQSAESLREGVFARVHCSGQGLDEQMCRKCLERTTVPWEYDAVRASYVLLDRLSSLRTSCKEEEECGQQCKERLVGTGDLETLEETLREVRAVFRPDPSKSCFSAEMVLNEVHSRSEALASLPREDATALLLIGHLYSGECIDVGESVADFLDDIFLHYGDGCERVMTQSGFAQLWNDLQMQRKGEHVDHSVRSACGGATTTTTLVVPRPESADASDVYLLGKEDEDEASSSSRRRRRARHTPEDHEHKNLANECLPSDALLHRFLSPGNQKITSSEFLQICPALVQQAVSGVCSGSRTQHKTGRNDTAMTPLRPAADSSQGASPWSAVVSVSAITAVSLLGLFLLPVLKKSFFVHVNAFFTGLAFGTMSGDVVMHIMPQYLGLHRHDDKDHDENPEDPPSLEFPTHLQRQLAFLLTMYLLFLFECIFTAFTAQGKESPHGHSHGGAVEIALRDIAAVGDIEDGEPKLSRCTRIVEFLRPSNLFSGMSSKAAVIVLADTVHNFADGMAIAVGFSTSYKDGFSTSIAVFFHELPHEIGDFAVLMGCGLGFWKAFVFNVLSGLSAFLGLGVGVGAAPLFREWLLCVTAGLFFFVVMVEMLPDMRLESKEKWPEFAVKVTGTVCGISTMIVIAIYELSVT